MDGVETNPFESIGEVAQGLKRKNPFEDIASKGNMRQQGFRPLRKYLLKTNGATSFKTVP